jgi:mRNA interferase MazF
VISRGEVHYVTLGPTVGREQSGRRPVLVVSADAINRQPLVITVVPGTDAANVRRDYPTNVRIPGSECGLSKDTVFLCFQIRSIDPERVMDLATRRFKPAGRISPARMQEIEAALRLVLGI